MASKHEHPTEGRKQATAVKEGGELLQLFQHAHHRVEGYLMDFCENLVQGRREARWVTRVRADLRHHVFVEEQVLFPFVKGRLAAVVAGLHQEHRRILDLTQELCDLLQRDADLEILQAYAARLMGALRAHNAAEDLGIYPDLLAALGSAKAQALLLEIETMQPPPGWMCASLLGTTAGVDP